eukprot:CAMPEP_0170364262 /NCGR_PEP_ID=MMETSP0117_2-20130122/5281_1 /TAXON_ID=400756 /ORGANISM="Durinskia baltica, Strain CSIRO CS-38" /LENGTH=53 /DNA_ID=CAMNT_0010618753 /DNA_START=1 /DNA_END=163 /DNA_ORIENTATION=+
MAVMASSLCLFIAYAASVGNLTSLDSWALNESRGLVTDARAEDLSRLSVEFVV